MRVKRLRNGALSVTILNPFLEHSRGGGISLLSTANILLKFPTLIRQDGRQSEDILSKVDVPSESGMRNLSILPRRHRSSIRRSSIRFPVKYVWINRGPFEMFIENAIHILKVKIYILAMHCQ